MKTALIPTLAAFALTACAGLPPSSQEIAALPVVKFGQPAPTGQAFVLYYPAGTPLPVTASVSGSLLERQDQAQLSVTLKRDVYSHKSWVSFDGKTWQRSSEVISGHFLVTLPGESDGRSPGTLSAEFNLK